MARVFSLEDGNLNTKPIIVSRSKTYSDIDLTFSAKVGGDIFKKTEAAAVKQSIKTLLMTNYGEKPFNFMYGANLNNFLFENIEDLDEDEITDVVSSAINNYEPRANFNAIRAKILPDYNTIQLTIYFQVINTMENEVLNLELTRLR